MADRGVRMGLLVAALLVGLVLGAVVTGAIRLGDWFGGGPDPETIAAASLESMREQNRLTPFAARYVAVVTSTQSRFGLTAQKTLIMPGMVRYEVDLGKLQQRGDRESDSRPPTLGGTRGGERSVHSTGSRTVTITIT